MPLVQNLQCSKKRKMETAISRNNCFKQLRFYSSNILLHKWKLEFHEITNILTESCKAAAAYTEKEKTVCRRVVTVAPQYAATGGPPVAAYRRIASP